MNPHPRSEAIADRRIYYRRSTGRNKITRYQLESQRCRSLIIINRVHCMHQEKGGGAGGEGSGEKEEKENRKSSRKRTIAPVR